MKKFQCSDGVCNATLSLIGHLEGLPFNLPALNKASSAMGLHWSAHE